ncbi:DoxX family protein [Polaribacter sp. PL03]|uniref:DoxX family membrane protein n=1 Tax=Polaribacter sp. PL03 TaxID=3088353 RepID=UPI0029D3EADA|nr:DoxX family membrane protein [Polaribacter sp. PL03]MDX6746319.1 DoxX family protein [Polaribacter sp. PL03]
MNKKLLFTFKLIAAVIMLQTLFYKFSGAQESIDLFTKVAGENEAFMRFGTGFIELFAAILLFIPKKAWFGAILTIGLMSGAIIAHLTKIGIVHNNDGGLLFGAAILTFLLALIILFLERKKLPFIGDKF